MPTATSSRRRHKLRSWQPPRISRPTHLRRGTRKEPCINPHSPDSDSSELRSTKTLLWSRRRKLRSGATVAPPLHPKRKRNTTFLEGRRARIAINATTTPETRLHSAKSIKREPNAHARPSPRWMKMKENSVELDASADLFGEHICHAISSFLRILRSSTARKIQNLGSAIICHPSSCTAVTKKPPCNASSCS